MWLGKSDGITSLNGRSKPENDSNSINKNINYSYSAVRKDVDATEVDGVAIRAPNEEDEAHPGAHGGGEGRDGLSEGRRGALNANTAQKYHFTNFYILFTEKNLKTDWEKWRKVEEKGVKGNEKGEKRWERGGRGERRRIRRRRPLMNRLFIHLPIEPSILPVRRLVIPFLLRSVFRIMRHNHCLLINVPNKSYPILFVISIFRRFNILRFRF